MENNINSVSALPIFYDAAPYHIDYSTTSNYHTNMGSMEGYTPQVTINTLQRDIELLKLEIQQIKAELKNTLRVTEREHRKLSI
jgi:hypothetical protein